MFAWAGDAPQADIMKALGYQPVVLEVYETSGGAPVFTLDRSALGGATGLYAPAWSPDGTTIAATLYLILLAVLSATVIGLITVWLAYSAVRMVSLGLGQDYFALVVA